MKSISIFFRLSVVMIFISNTSFSANSYCISSKNSSSVITPFAPFTHSYVPSNNMKITELTDFVGVCEDGSVVLKWNAATENVNSNFIIEQSNNAVNWTTIGIVNGGVISSNLLAYSFIDPQVYDGTSYYRLKCTEVNGDFKYSKIIDINNCHKVLSENDLTIYPNPSYGILNLLFYGDENLLESIEIFNVFGNKIYSTTNFQPLLDLTSKPEGIYFIHFNLNSKSIIKKITSQH